MFQNQNLFQFYLVFLFVLYAHYVTIITGTSTNENSKWYREEWGYIPVRPKAEMFWWHYYQPTQPYQNAANRPLIMWLQGGPGSSSCGYGNFELIGPLDDNLKIRNTTWLKKADLLFVDNPVGTGFSYVTDDQAYTTDINEISKDLVSFAHQWFSSHAQFRNQPFYIFGESYGGKMAAAFAYELHKATVSGEVKCNLKGVAMGDSWISPIDYVTEWGPYLYYFSYFSDTDLQSYTQVAQKCQNMVSQGHWRMARSYYIEAQYKIIELGISFYNVLKQPHSDPWSKALSLLRHSRSVDTDRLLEKHIHMETFYSWGEKLYDLMNGEIRRKLRVIPPDVKWEQHSEKVSRRQDEDFMKPVVHIVDKLLNISSLKVVVYQGQLDVICCTSGTEKWVKKLKWPGLHNYYTQKRNVFTVGPPQHVEHGFYKKYKNFAFYWIMKAGHMVPADAPYAALKMLDMTFQ